MPTIRDARLVQTRLQLSTKDPFSGEGLLLMTMSKLVTLWVTKIWPWKWTKKLAATTSQTTRMLHPTTITEKETKSTIRIP